MAETKIQGVVPADATVESRPDLFGTRGQLRPDGEGGLLSYMLADKPEYATPESSGIEAGFYNGRDGLPWHVSLARALNTPELMQDSGRLITSKEALPLTGSFTVGRRALAVADSGLIIPGHFATVREDTGAPLGVVGRNYTVFQERELAEFADILVDSGEAKWDSGGHMRGGAWFFLSMKLAALDIIVPGDPSSLATYLLLFTSHDGSRPASFHMTQVRAVCKNTCDLAKKGAITQWNIRHSGSLSGKVEQARLALRIAFRNAELVKEITGKLAETNLVDQQVREIFARAWPVAVAEGEEAREKQSLHATRAFARYESSADLDGIRGTAWGAYNAVTEYLDHGVVYRGRKRQNDEDARAGSLLFGGAHAVKQRALEAALEFTE